MTSRRFFLVSDIVDEVLRLQGEVSAALEASDYPTGLNKGLKAFTKLAEVLDSRNRRYYIPILNTIINSGVHCGKSYDQATYELSFQMTLLMVKILLELEEWARARSLAENTLEDVQSGPFPQCKRDIGRLYVLQGLASKGMNDMKTAEKELTYGLVFLPNDPMIIQELVSMRLYLRDIDGDPFATLTEAVVAAGTGECSLCDRQKFLGKKLAV